MESTDSIFPQQAIARTRAWVEQAVIGLNLCPFAKAVHVRQQIRYVVSMANTPLELHADLLRQLISLADADPEEADTCLLIHPFVLTDFLDYNDFLAIADATIAELGFGSQIQIASFHPDYQFADTTAHDIGNCTNRSPYPTLHLLREASLDRAVAAFPKAGDIFNKNIATMQRLGQEGWEKLKASIEAVSDPK